MSLILDFTKVTDI